MVQYVHEVVRRIKAKKDWEGVTEDATLCNSVLILLRFPEIPWKCHPKLTTWRMERSIHIHGLRDSGLLPGSLILPHFLAVLCPSPAFIAWEKHQDRKQIDAQPWAMQISGRYFSRKMTWHEQNSWKGHVLSMLKTSKTLNVPGAQLRVFRERHKMRSEF